MAIFSQFFRYSRCFLALFVFVVGLTANKHAFATENLEEVVVVASRIETNVRSVGTALTVITDDEVKKSAYPSFTDLLQRSTAINVSNSGGIGQPTSVRIRGEESFRTLILIDGIDNSDVGAPQAATAIEHIINDASTQRIEILRGPQGFIYGADSGGVINVISRDIAAGFDGNIETQFGSHEQQQYKMLLSSGTDRGGILIAASDTDSEGFNARSDDSSQDKDGYENTTLHSKLSWQLNDRISADVIVRKIDAESEYDGCSFSSNDCITDNQQQNIKAGITLLHNDASHSISVVQTKIDRDYYTDGSLGFSLDANSNIADYVAQQPLNEAFTLVYGAELRDDRVRSPGQDDLTRERQAAFGELQWNWQESLYINSGIRQDFHDEFDDFTSTRLSVVYVPVSQSALLIKYRASVGTGFRAPSLQEIAYNAGPYAFGEASMVNLQPEESIGYDVGIDYFWGDVMKGSIAYFNQKIDNEIYFDLVQFSGYLQAQGQNLSKGWEGDVEYHLSPLLTLGGNFLLNETEDRFGQPRGLRPEQIVNLYANLPMISDRLNIRVNWRSVKDQVADVFAVGLVPMSDYQTVDSSVHYSFLSNFELFARINNITREEYEEVLGYNTAGRTFNIGGRLTF